VSKDNYCHCSSQTDELFQAELVMDNDEYMPQLNCGECPCAFVSCVVVARHALNFLQQRISVACRCRASCTTVSRDCLLFGNDQGWVFAKCMCRIIWIVTFIQNETACAMCLTHCSAREDWVLCAVHPFAAGRASCSPRSSALYRCETCMPLSSHGHTPFTDQRLKRNCFFFFFFES
jgi:hypothetical protein